MKKTNVLLIGAAAAAVVFTGCSSMNGEKTTSMEPAHVNNAVVSTLAIVPSTDTAALTRWPREWNIQSVDLYTFKVPTTVADTGSLPEYRADLAPGTVFVEAAGAERTGQAMEVVRYAPSSH